MVVEERASQLLLRRAALADIPAIRAIDEQVYPRLWSEKMLTEQIVGADRLHVVAMVAEGLAGHAGIIFMAGVGHVSTVAVDPALQRRSIGRNLMLALFRAAIHRGASAVTLEVRAGNDPALALYRAFEMTTVGVRRGYYADNGDDALVLWSPDLDGTYSAQIATMSFAGRVIVGADLSGACSP